MRTGCADGRPEGRTAEAAPPDVTSAGRAPCGGGRGGAWVTPPPAGAWRRRGPGAAATRSDRWCCAARRRPSARARRGPRGRAGAGSSYARLSCDLTDSHERDLDRVAFGVVDPHDRGLAAADLHGDCQLTAPSLIDISLFGHAMCGHLPVSRNSGPAPEGAPVATAKLALSQARTSGRSRGGSGTPAWLRRVSRSGSGRRLAIEEYRGRAMLAREQVLDADLRVDHRSPQALFSALGLGQLPGPVPVAPPRPGRARPGQPGGADDEQRRHEQADQPGP